MIDLHSHILYGLDDGPSTLDESLEMCRVAYGDGVRTIVATPHMLNGVYRSTRTAILSRTRELNAALRSALHTQVSERGVPPSTLRSPVSPLSVLPGADVHLAEDLLQPLNRKRLLTVGDGGRYLLVEFPSQVIPPMAEKILFNLIGQGIVPIITHPERNLEIGRKPSRYYEMVRMGCLGQVTAMSLTGGFGPEVRRLAEDLLIRRMVHLIASDAHSVDLRPPVLRPAVMVASKLVGLDEATKMVTEYPQAILEGKRLDRDQPLPL